MSPPQLLRHAARSSLSHGRRRILPASVHLTTRTDVHQHQRRPLATDCTRPLYAQPNKFVTGVTPEQLAESQAMRDWYKANFADWEDEPDKVIIGEEEEESKKEEKAKEEEEDANPSIIQLPDDLVRRNIRPIVAYLREPGIEEGSRNCYKLRNPKVTDPIFPLIPGMLHGSDPTNGIVSVDQSSKVIVKTPWFEIQRELDRYHYGRTGSFENRVYALTVFPSEEASLDHHRTRHPKDKTTYKVDDETMELIEIPGPPLPVPPPRTPVPGMENILVLPADMQLHPVAHQAFCLNFVRYHPGKPIKIPIKFINEEESRALKGGGFLLKVNPFLECLVEDGVPIPECIELECTGLKQKDVVRRERFIMPEGVTIHPRVADDFLVGTVFGARGGGEDDADGEAEGDAK